MFDQLTIGEKKSLDDFDASVASRAIGSPAKKVIKETVPFSNKTYDFSKINGELYWEERELEYVFEITADNPEQLEEKKRNFSGWIMNVMEEEIYDPFDPDFYFIGTYDNLSYDDDEGMEKTTATVVFNAYPFRIANDATMYALPATPERTEYTLNNKSSHAVKADVTVGGETTIVKGAKQYIFPKGGTYEDALPLEPGENVMAVSCAKYGFKKFSSTTGDTSEYYAVITSTAHARFYDIVTVDSKSGNLVVGNTVTFASEADFVANGKGVWLQDSANPQFVIVFEDINADTLQMTTYYATEIKDNVEIGFYCEVF